MAPSRFTPIAIASGSRGTSSIWDANRPPPAPRTIADAILTG
jgi:hypothetical protein